MCKKKRDHGNLNKRKAEANKKSLAFQYSKP